MAGSSSEEQDKKRKSAGVAPVPQDIASPPAISLAALSIFL
jgi:hypothetical protein